MERRVTRGRAVVVVLATLAVVIAQLMVPKLAPPAAAAPTDPGSITLHVKSARSVNTGPGFVHKGDPITDYKWLINLDDVGDPGTALNQGTDKCLPASAGAVGSTDPHFADTCQWPSIRNTAGQAPIIAQGNQDDLSSTTALENLPVGKYLISVMADGFKIDGQHFTVADGQTATPVIVEMNPTPLPLTTLRIQVFNDNHPVDATYEVDAEQGLAGFTAHLSDVFGPASVDYYGNAMCTKYMHTGRIPLFTDAQRPNNPIAFDAGKPVIDPASTGRCVSGATGEIVIPNMGPNRFAATVTPPVPAAGQTYQWVQTTTLEGGHDHDIWSQEGATGYDTEQLKGTELVPSVQFGFVRTQAIRIPRTNVPTGEIKGVVDAGLPYIGGTGGQVGPDGFAGTKVGAPIKSPWIALSDLGAGDAQIYVGRGAVDGSFDIKNVPDGTYQLTMWDDDQDYILWSVNVDVANGALTDVGVELLVGWFTHIHGNVFVDTNANGKRDTGEQGIPAFPLTVRERDNSMMDQATNAVTTDDSGNYDIAETYPMGKWLVLEAFDTRYKTTGITYRGENETKATTKLGALVDLNFLPIIGLGSQIDWGVQPYDAGTNGGIVGTVSYDTTRNELDPAQAATEGYSPGIPNVDVRLYASVPCTATTDAEKANTCRQGKQIVPLTIPDPADATASIPNPDANRGALVKGPELQDAYTSETWAPPRGCTARQYDGTLLTDQKALPDFGTIINPTTLADESRMCVEAPMMGVAVGPSDTTDPTSVGQTVNGNYGFGTSKLNLWPATDTVHNPSGLALYTPLPAGEEQDLRPADYIVSVDIPNDPVDGKPMYKATSEEDVNVFDGDTYLPQQNYPPATPDAADNAAPAPRATPLPPTQPPSQTGGIVSDCAGALHNVEVTNQAFLDGGGSPFEGMDRPSCADKLVTVRNGQATAPNFNLFTDVPLPTHFWGLTLNDLGLTLDKRSVNYGEAQGLPFVPVGLYDSFGRLSYTTHTDFNGLYEALVPPQPGRSRRNGVSPLDALKRQAPDHSSITSSPGIDRVGTVIPAASVPGGWARTQGGVAAGTDATVNFAGSNPLTPGINYTWTGTVNVPAADTYGLWLQRSPGIIDAAGSLDPTGGRGGSNSGAVSLSVDGAVVPTSAPSTILANTYPGGPTIGGQYQGLQNNGAFVPLTAGPHTLTVGFNVAAAAAAPVYFRLTWSPVQASIDAAVAVAAAAKTAVVFVDDANSTSPAGEVNPLGRFQDQLVTAVAAANPRTVVVLNTGDPVLMPWLASVKAVLEMWYPGQEGGTATANVLRGRANPGGKLPITFPVSAAQTPFAGHPERILGVAGVTTWSEGLQVGYRWYDAQNLDPLFPFGFGLSYTKFNLSRLHVSSTRDGGFDVSVRVRNLGSRRGAEVVQVYLGASPNVPSGIQQVEQKLVQFARVELGAGHARTVTVHINPQDLTYWSTAGQKWVTGTGHRQIFVGNSSRNLPLSRTINVH